jgi:hypothetical protein
MRGHGHTDGATGGNPANPPVRPDFGQNPAFPPRIGYFYTDLDIDALRINADTFRINAAGFGCNVSAFRVKAAAFRINADTLHNQADA